jgi:hypothetical protein
VGDARVDPPDDHKGSLVTSLTEEDEMAKRKKKAKKAKKAAKKK